MQQVPGHPYASYWTGTDAMNQFWIICRCSRCGAEWRKQCSRPNLANSHIYRFSVEHGHGVRPTQVSR